MGECSGTSVGTSQTDVGLALPGSSASTSSSSIIPRRDLLDGTFFEYLPQESTAHDVTALCKMCLPMSVKIKGPDESSINFTGHLKRKHGDRCLSQYKKFIKRKKDDVEYRKMSKNSEQVRKIAEEQFKQNIVNYTIGAMIPLEYVDNPYFFSFLENINVPKKYLESLCYEKIERYLDEEFESQMNEIKSKIIKASYVCTSCDVWKRRDKQYLSATAHWFTEDLNRVSVALSCMEYTGTPPYYDLKQFLEPIFAEFALCSDVDRVSAVFIEDSRVFIRALSAYGVNNQSMDCKDHSSILEILTEPANTESTGSLLIWVKEDICDEYYSMPDIVDCTGRNLRLTATVDFIDILYNSSDDLFLIHDATIKKCNYLWTAASYKLTSKVIFNVLGHNLIRPNTNKWNSLYDAFRQILTLKFRNKELHEALGFTHVINDDEFKYLEEHLRCAMPVAEAMDKLMNKKNNYYGIVLPCLMTLQKKIKEMEDKSEMIFCSNLVSGLKRSVETRFKDMIDLSNIEAEHAAIASICCPQFKNKWLTDHPMSRGILNIFEALVTREFISDGGENETPKKYTEEFVVLKTDNGEIVDLTVPGKPVALKNAEIIVKRYFADKSEELEMLDRHPEIKKIFIEYNSPLASAVTVNKIFDSDEFMLLSRNNEIGQEILFKRVIMKYNQDSIKYLRRND